MSSNSVTLTIGPVFVGVLFNILLYGICILQFFSYYATGFKDPLVIRLLVVYELVLDTFHSAAGAYLLWVWCVTNYNNPDSLAMAPWPFPATPIVTAFTSCPIQIFLSWRIKQFSRSRAVFTALSICSIAQGALACATAARALKLAKISHFHEVIPISAAWNSLSAVLDLTLTILLTYYLSKHRTGVRQTDSVVSKLIKNSVETSAVVTFFGIMDLAMFAAFPSLNFHFIFALASGRLYSNTLLLTLNSRVKLRNKMLAIQELGATEAFGTNVFNAINFLHTNTITRSRAPEVRAGTIQTEMALDSYESESTSNRNNSKQQLEEAV